MSERSESTSTTNTNLKPVRRKRWPWFLGGVVLLFLLAPNVITMLGLEQQAVDWAMADFKGNITIGRSSAGWFQPIKLKNIVVVDELGQPMFSAAEIRSSNRLWSFFGSDDYGHFEIKQPIIDLHLRPDGSNLEDVLASFSAQPDAPETAASHTNSSHLPKMSFSVVDGTARITSSTTTEAWAIDQMKLAIDVRSETASVASVIQCRVTSFLPDSGGTQIPQSSGELSLSAELDPGSADLKMEAVHATIGGDQVPVSILAPFAQRFLGPAQFAGNLNCDVAIAYDLNAGAVAASVESMKLTDLQMLAPDVLGNDQFYIASTNARGRLDLSPATLAAEQFEFNTDFGKLTANGSFDIQQINQLSGGNQLPNADFQMNGNLDLAQLVRMLPETFHTHQNLVVESGTASFHVGSRSRSAEPSDRQLVFVLDTANLKANRAGQSIVWQEPIRIEGDVVQNNGSMALKRLQCTSDFLEINGNVGFSEGVLDVEGDLGLLTQRIGQFIDLQGFATGGRLSGKFGWQVRDQNGAVVNSLQSFATSQDRPIEVLGRFDIKNPVVRMSGLPDWQQPSATIGFDANLTTLASGPLRFDRAQMDAQLGSEQFFASLSEPIADLYADQVWRFDTRAIGNLSGFLRHIQNFVDLGPVSADGTADISAVAGLANGRLVLNNLNYSVENLAFNGYSLRIREPRVNGLSNLAYDFATGAIEIADATFESSTLSARGENLQVQAAENVLVHGGIAFRANVNRFADWLQLSPTNDAVFWFGDAGGSMQLTSDERGINANTNIEIENLTAAGRVLNAGQNGGFQTVGQTVQFSPFWSEPKVGISGGIKLAHNFDALLLSGLAIESKSLNANLNGNINQLSSRMLADLSGVWNPRWELVNSLLDAYTGKTVQLAGQGEQSFLLRGPLFPSSEESAATGAYVSRSLQASTRVAWSGGRLLDLPIGGSHIDLILDQGVASIESGIVSLSNGQVKIQPKIDLRSADLVLYHPQARVLDRIELNAETCRQGLKYLNPLVAQATDARGQFSVDIESIQMPLDNPAAVSARSLVTLHRVEISAGQVANELIGTVQQLETLLKPEKNGNQKDLGTWLTMSEQVVPVNVQNGRVYHEGIRFTHDGVTIETTGSVGFDQTLDLVAQIPIPDQWLEKSKYLEGLRGQKLSVPVTGTISQPIFDQQAIRGLSAQIAQSAGSNALNRVLQEKLSPKLGEFQTNLNEKIGGGLNRLQNQFQDQIGGKLKQGLEGALKQPFRNGSENPLGDLLKLPGSGIPNRDSAGNVLPPGNGQIPTPTGPIGPTGQQRPGVNPAGQPVIPTSPPTVKQNLENELIRGIGNLFK